MKNTRLILCTLLLPLFSVATMCPICLVSLRKINKTGMKTNDLSDTLAKAYGV